ncbi:hypothetical protein PAPYR_8060 [Paratrimastix pyriformis]|uniref:Uncharacterized protein n=1 Tax=Paratrimastix pyriformis TaxID=342808 RepID=A0ABQ8UFL7_9EUKA|nr:hypothetical protein PAPYR_8060 [Paratrimastix pyriformis]
MQYVECPVPAPAPSASNFEFRDVTLLSWRNILLAVPHPFTGLYFFRSVNPFAAAWTRAKPSGKVDIQHPLCVIHGDYLFVFHVPTVKEWRRVTYSFCSLASSLSAWVSGPPLAIGPSPALAENVPPTTPLFTHATSSGEYIVLYSFNRGTMMALLKQNPPMGYLTVVHLAPFRYMPRTHDEKPPSFRQGYACVLVPPEHIASMTPRHHPMLLCYGGVQPNDPTSNCSTAVWVTDLDPANPASLNIWRWVWKEPGPCVHQHTLSLCGARILCIGGATLQPYGPVSPSVNLAAGIWALDPATFSWSQFVGAGFPELQPPARYAVQGLRLCGVEPAHLDVLHTRELNLGGMPHFRWLLVSTPGSHSAAASAESTPMPAALPPSASNAALLSAPATATAVAAATVTPPPPPSVPPTPAQRARSHEREIARLGEQVHALESALRVSQGLHDRDQQRYRTLQDFARTQHEADDQAMTILRQERDSLGDQVRTLTALTTHLRSLKRHLSDELCSLSGHWSQKKVEVTRCLDGLEQAMQAFRERDAKAAMRRLQEQLAMAREENQTRAAREMELAGLATSLGVQPPNLETDPGEPARTGDEVATLIQEAKEHNTPGLDEKPTPATPATSDQIDDVPPSSTEGDGAMEDKDEDSDWVIPIASPIGVPKPPSETSSSPDVKPK